VHIFVKIESIYVKPRPAWSTANSTHIAGYISPAKCFVLVISVCNYPGGGHVAAATGLLVFHVWC